MFRSDETYIILESLDCVQTEDADFDELMLWFRVDEPDGTFGALELIKRMVNAGEKVPLQTIIPLRERQIFKLRLEEDDDSMVINPNDVLGTLELRGDELSPFQKPQPNLRSHAFRRGRAHYKLHYRIVTPRLLQQTMGSKFKKGTATPIVRGPNGRVKLSEHQLQGYKFMGLTGRVLIGADVAV